MSECQHTDERVDERQEHGLVVVTNRCTQCGRLAKVIEDESPARFDAVAVAVPAEARELKFATSPDFGAPYDLILNTRTGELVRVDELGEDGTRLVTRGIGGRALGGIPASDMLAADEVLKVGNCCPENPQVGHVNLQPSPAT